MLTVYKRLTAYVCGFSGADYTVNATYLEIELISVESLLPELVETASTICCLNPKFGRETVKSCFIEYGIDHS
jgi:hypothetical protein